MVASRDLGPVHVGEGFKHLVRAVGGGRGAKRNIVLGFKLFDEFSDRDVLKAKTS